MFRSRIDEFFEPKILGAKGPRNTVVSVDVAKGLLDSKAAAMLPNIQTVHNSPVFVEDHGKLRVLQQGYHGVEGGKYIASNRRVDTSISLETAKKALLDLVSDFEFASPSDKSRCLAGFISPALRFGGLLKTHFPLDLCEADESQSGKDSGQNS
jgi:hypothetical protein